MKVVPAPSSVWTCCRAANASASKLQPSNTCAESLRSSDSLPGASGHSLPQWPRSLQSLHQVVFISCSFDRRERPRPLPRPRPPPRTRAGVGSLGGPAGPPP
eukprot:2720843-Pyramimonas_sp.AAC.1